MQFVLLVCLPSVDERECGLMRQGRGAFIEVSPSRAPAPASKFNVPRHHIHPFDNFQRKTRQRR